MINTRELYQEEKIMQKFINRYERRHLHSYSTPMTISFLVTNKCNLRCKHCFNNKTVLQGQKSDKELDLDEYERLAESMDFFPSGLFCGGEPFLRKDLAEIVTIFENKCNMQYASSTTNGLLTDNILEQTEKILQNDGRKRYVLNFSLDGFEKEHSFIRGEGVYEKCIQTIKEVNKLKKKYSNLQTGIVTTMTTVNEDIVCDFFDFISKEVQPNVISLLKVRQSPRGGDQLKEINSKNYYNAKEKLNEMFLEGRNGNPISPVGYYPLAFYEIIQKSLVSGKREFYCYAGTHGAYIDYNGYVNACEIVGDADCSGNPLSMGYLRDFNMDFDKLWNSEQAMQVRMQINRHKCCEGCTHETEGILPSIYFEPNSVFYRERMDKLAGKQ